MKNFDELVKLNLPNGVTLAIINMSDLQAMLSVSLTVVSIVSTLVILYRNLKRKD